MLKIFILLLSSLTSACAILHHVQVGDIYHLNKHKYMPIEVKMSEFGMDLSKFSSNRSLSRSSRRANQSDASSLAGIISLFQMGPSTGYRVFSENYARNLIYLLHKKCPSGKLTAINSIRENRNYHVISGEIVKVTALCIL